VKETLCFQRSCLFGHIGRLRVGSSSTALKKKALVKSKKPLYGLKERLLETKELLLVAMERLRETNMTTSCLRSRRFGRSKTLSLDSMRL
jgi:hypothetical protein